MPNRPSRFALQSLIVLSSVQILNGLSLPRAGSDARIKLKLTAQALAAGQTDDAKSKSGDNKAMGSEKSSSATNFERDPHGQIITDVYKVDENLKAHDGDDDFDRLKKSALPRKSSGELSADEKMEQELAQLREARKRADAERERDEKLSKDRSRQEARKKSAERAARAKQYEEELKGKVSELDGVSESDIQWNGLR